MRRAILLALLAGAVTFVASLMLMWIVLSIAVTVAQ